MRSDAEEGSHFNPDPSRIDPHPGVMRGHHSTEHICVLTHQRHRADGCTATEGEKFLEKCPLSQTNPKKKLRNPENGAKIITSFC
jgi:hypothetical protein